MKQSGINAVKVGEGCFVRGNFMCLSVCLSLPAPTPLLLSVVSICEASPPPHSFSFLTLTLIRMRIISFTSFGFQPGYTLCSRSCHGTFKGVSSSTGHVLNEVSLPWAKVTCCFLSFIHSMHLCIGSFSIYYLHCVRTFHRQWGSVPNTLLPNIFLGSEPLSQDESLLFPNVLNSFLFSSENLLGFHTERHDSPCLVNVYLRGILRVWPPFSRHSVL